MKSHLLEAYKKKKSEASRGSTSQAEERVDPTSEEHVDLSLEEPVNPPPVELPKEKKRKSFSGGDKHPKKKKTSSSTEVNTEAGTSQPDVEVSSFIAQPVTSTTVAFFQHFIPPLDVPVVSSASDKKITEALASNFLQAREVAHSSKRSLNDVMAKHDKLMKEIEEVRGASDAEKRSLEQKLTDSEASIIRLQEEMKKAGEEAEEKIKRAQEEAEASWEKRKADFLKSDEFDRLCSTRALSFFQQGFDGCLAQIRDNGYSEAEHPFSFLDVLKSLEALPDDGEAGLSGAKN
ncbi:phragmoplast orienting kinesin 2 [Dorcoceras hygrometricum]|uniref:Phragmoplast orienting kinesin 2 n=1 Tax=Dorcoceras hygrometricum TaxID=472368 RepID=A0A2Z7BU75_9LAMI|nr:phragmoplast orienting kinesin 2 [Dorcoceras hygrometricum]